MKRNFNDLAQWKKTFDALWKRYLIKREKKIERHKKKCRDVFKILKKIRFYFYDVNKLFVESSEDKKFCLDFILEMYQREVSRLCRE
jgi:hypothetical protein